MYNRTRLQSNHILLCHPFLLLPSIFPSIRVFPNESVLCIRWLKYWSFSFSISPSNEYSGLISFRTDWLDLLAVQMTLKSLLQHHSSKASILWPKSGASLPKSIGQSCILHFYTPIISINTLPRTPPPPLPRRPESETTLITSSGVISVRTLPSA